MKSIQDVIVWDVESTNDDARAADVLRIPSWDSADNELKVAAQVLTPPELASAERNSIAPGVLTLVQLDRQQIESVLQAIPGGATDLQDIYPLSPLQEGMLSDHLLKGQSDTYVLSTSIELQSRAQVDALVEALQKVMHRHDVLRSALLWQKLPRPVQIVHRHVALPVEEFSLNGDSDPAAQLKERMRSARRMLELQQAPLMRLQVAADPHDARWHALLHVHRLVCDHQSLRVVIAEAITCLEGREHELPVPLLFRNYVAEALAQTATSDSEGFFRSKLNEIEEPTAPFELVDMDGDGHRAEEAVLSLDCGLARRVRSRACLLGVSAASLFHAAWGLVVAHTSGREDVVYGTVLLAAQHSASRAQRVVGTFENTLPLRLRLRDVTAKELVEQAQRELAALLSHAHTSAAVVHRCCAIAGATPLFTTLFNYRHSELDWKSEVTGRSGIRVLAGDESRTNYAVSLTVDDLGEGFILKANTYRSIDPCRMTAYLQTALESLMEALELTPQAPALLLSIMPALERQQVIERFNATESAYPHDKVIQELFEEQVARTPQAVAVAFREQSLTYAELNSRANQLARYLRSRRLAPDQLVALCVERSIEMVVGMLGILKAGAAYVPLDPSYPTGQLAHMLEDAAPKLLLIQQHLQGILPDTRCATIALDADWNEVSPHITANLDRKTFGLSSQHLAYVIYTSGSTGEPKGVMIEHRNVVSLWKGLEQIYRQASNCRRVAVNASFNFDASVKQFVQLLSGRTVVLVPQECRWDARALLDFLDEHQIDGIDCTPWQLRSWVSAGLLESKHHLRLSLVGGEAIDADLWKCLARSCETNFYNVYGPTESTVDASAALLNGSTSVPHIGRPIENRRIYILDRRQQPVPIGVTGEIHIAGAGIARGYLHRPELTSERFVLDPFSPDLQSRMYKSGDLGRWRADGTIEYLGRNDHQVKIRGFRIELGEIQAQLERHEGVKEAVVIAREDLPGEKRLVAYVIPRNPAASPNVDALRTHLKLVLPDHMVPSAFMTIERIPLTSNGKLDRRALSAPDPEAYSSGQYEAPQGAVEELLAGIWRRLLRVERVGRQDDFFDLGGHSLLAMQVVAHIQSSLLIEPSVRLLFEFPTLQQLAAQLDGLRRTQLLDRIADGGTEIEALLEKVASMPESQVRDLLNELNVEGRP